MKRIEMANQWLLVLLFFWGFSSVAHGVEKKLEAAVQNFKQTVLSTIDKDEKVKVNKDILFTALDEGLKNAGSLEGMSAENAIRELSERVPSADIQKAGGELLDVIYGLKEERVNDYIQKVDSTGKEASQLIISAKKAEELDGLINQLDILRLRICRDKRFSREMEEARGKVSRWSDETKQWQNYLCAVTFGDVVAAKSILGDFLSNRDRSDLLVPRSFLLARKASLNDIPVMGKISSEEFGMIVGGIKRLEDLRPALERLRGMKEALEKDREMMSFYDAFKTIVSRYEAVRDGLPVSYALIANSSGGMLEQLPIRRQLLIFYYKLYFDVSEEPLESEEILNYVGRISQNARSKQDWVRFQKTLLAKEYLERQSTPGGGSSLTRPDGIVAAINQERARQYAMAVVSYQSLLKIPSTTIPVDFIEERLALIQKEHWSDYEEGNKQFFLLQQAIVNASQSPYNRMMNEFNRASMTNAPATPPAVSPAGASASPAGPSTP